MNTQLSIRAFICITTAFSAISCQQKTPTTCTPNNGLLPKIVDKVTGNSFTLRDYKFVQHGLKATCYSLNGMLSLGSEKRAAFLKLEQDATKKALAWENCKPWYNPALNIDLYNPMHLLALTITAYTSCRLAEDCIIKPTYNAARTYMRTQIHDR